jgi:hypothetical protein
MASETLDAHYGRRVTVDLCRPCGAFWFDKHESISLTPGAVLHLFVVIGERPTDRQPLAGSPRCPRCRGTLAATSDVQRGVPFRYWRCAGDHGRFIAFAEFLREKNFVRPLGGDELAALRARVKMIHCSSCGAPVDLTKTSACGHCRAPVSILDPAQVEKVVAQLRRDEEARQTVDPTLPARLMMDRLRAEGLFRKLEGGSGWSEAPDLLDVGIAAIADLLTGN